MRRIVITGCSGGGKSTLLAELARRGHATVAEPGRRVIDSERARGGTGLPWEDMDRFSDLAFRMAVADHAAASRDPTYFDRSALDQAAWFAREGKPIPGPVPRYATDVVMVPPWPEIYVTDADRRHGFDDALAEYRDLEARLPAWGYRCHVLPKADVATRVGHVLALTRALAA